MPRSAWTCAGSNRSRSARRSIGNRTRVRVVKNKVAPPFRTAEFDIMFNEGISKIGDMLDLASSLEIISKRGAFFSYGDIRLGQGRENAKEFLRQNPELSAEIEKAVRQRTMGGELPASMATEDQQSEMPVDEEL